MATNHQNYMPSLAGKRRLGIEDSAVLFAYVRANETIKGGHLAAIFTSDLVATAW